MLSNQSTNLYIHDPVPKNVSKFPIHQTYLTSDAERTGDGGYRFKAPEVWSSARSGKKSIAIRSIQRLHKSELVKFTFQFHKTSENDDESNDFYFNYSDMIDSSTTVKDVCADIAEKLSKFIDDNSLSMTFTFTYDDLESELYLKFEHTSADYDDDESEYNNYWQFKIIDSDDPELTPHPPESFYRLFNQPLNQSTNFMFELKLNNVWNRDGYLYFHSSFIPFDRYQFLGELHDEWNNPIVYQDPNGSPLFNVWTTLDLKTPYPILHEHFIIRITFIISSNDFYN